MVGKSDPTLSQFIYYGMRKEGWPHFNEGNVKDILNDPTLLDEEDNEPFERDFYKYYDWYWANQRAR